jgi:hypothetical protein
MVNHIATHQNSAVFFHLFKYNIVEIIRREVPINSLLESKVFNMDINFIEWPQLSEDTERCFAHYNGSMFKMRFEFPSIFPQKHA